MKRTKKGGTLEILTWTGPLAMKEHHQKWGPDYGKDMGREPHRDNAWVTEEGYIISTLGLNLCLFFHLEIGPQCA